MSHSRSRSVSPPRRRAESYDAPARGGDRGDAPAGNNLFIGNITYNTRERELNDIFSKFGKVQEARIAVDKDTGRSKGYGFVTMEDARDAADAAKDAQGMLVDGREMRVEISHGKKSQPGISSTACRDFHRGSCSYGDKCRFSHDENAGRGRDDRGYGRDDRGYGRDDRGSYGRDDRGHGRDRDFGRDRRDDRGYGRDDRRDDRRGGDRYDDRGYGRDDERDRRDRGRGRRSPSPRRDRDRSRDRY